MAKDKKESSLTYWEKRAVEQDAELHKGIKKPESAILSAYIQTQEYLKAEAKKIYDRYVQQPGMTESMFNDILNTKASDRDLMQLASMAKSVHDKQVKKQIQAYLNALAAKARITRLEMLRAKAYVVAKQLADVQLRQEEAFLTKAAQQAYQQAAVEAVIGKTTRDVQLHTPDAIPNQRKLPNAIVFENPETGEVVKELALKPASSVKQFTQLSNTQTKALLDTHWVGGNYSTRIWGNTDQLAKRLQQLFTAQQMSGMTERDMAQALQNEFNVGAYVARRLIRTEANFVAGQAKLRGWREHGVKQYVLIAVLDFRTSSICRNKDGQVFNVTDAHCDGPNGNYPPFHSFCRTVASAYYGKETFVGTHKVNNPLGRPIEMPAGTTYHVWEKALNDKYGLEAVELERDKELNAKSDYNQFQEFKDVMADKLSQSFGEFQDIKHGNLEEWQRIKDRKYVLEHLKSGKWHDTLNADKQSDHIEGTAREGASYFAEDVDVEALYNQYKGTGVLMRTRTGDIRPVEYIRVPVDGKDISTIDGTEAPIEGFYIHYSSGKTVRNHLVPTRKVIDYGKTE